MFFNRVDPFAQSRVLLCCRCVVVALSYSHSARDARAESSSESESASLTAVCPPTSPPHHRVGGYRRATSRTRGTSRASAVRAQSQASACVLQTLPCMHGPVLADSSVLLFRRWPVLPKSTVKLPCHLTLGATATCKCNLLSPTVLARGGLCVSPFSIAIHFLPPELLHCQSISKLTKFI